jgi:hypothetical protein
MQVLGGIFVMVLVCHSILVALSFRYFAISALAPPLHFHTETTEQLQALLLLHLP